MQYKGMEIQRIGIDWIVRWIEMGWDGGERQRDRERREIKNKKVRQVLKKIVGKGKWAMAFLRFWTNKIDG